MYHVGLLRSGIRYLGVSPHVLHRLALYPRHVGQELARPGRPASAPLEHTLMNSVKVLYGSFPAKTIREYYYLI